ncbi:MAG: GGDEF domain-containing protein [Thermoanaerobaculia bacterium]
MRVFKSTYLRNILLVSLAIGIVLPLYDVLFIFPAVSELLVENTRYDAIRVARHLSSLLISETGELNNDFLTRDLLNEIEELAADFDVVKLRVFSDTGEVLFSTDPEEIGDINRERYFSEIVGKGEVYTKVVWKEQESLEGQTMTSDVVETYVPLMNDGEHRGAFEIYYDITAKKEQLDGLLSRSSTIIIALAFGLVTVIIVSLIKESRSIAERERAEEKIHYLAHYDTLTDLPNRLLFKEHLSRALVSAQRNSEMLAVLFVDLDNFKQVNDTHGHGVGDLLLQDVANRFGKTLRKSDVLARQRDEDGPTSIARFGGDEFIVLLSDIEGAPDAARAARRVLDALSAPFALDGHEISVGASIGISLYPQDGEDLETLTKNADAAMYRAKSQGTKNYRFHSQPAQQMGVED